MNRIVIVEDMLKRGISLAEQFGDFAAEHPELKIQVAAVCYFNFDTAAARKDIEDMQNQKNYPFEIRHVSLLDFEEVLDEYTDPGENQAIVIMDFILKDDGSEGVHRQRINIAYFGSVKKARKKQIWFYTAIGTRLHEILVELVKADHVLEVTDVGEALLHLDLNDEKFVRKLQANAADEG